MGQRSLVGGCQLRLGSWPTIELTWLSDLRAIDGPDATTTSGHLRSATVHQTFLTRTDVPATRAKWTMTDSKLVARRRPKSQTTAYLKSLRTMKRRKIAPATYNTALPAWRQAVFRWLRAVVLVDLSDCHLARASPER
jgi:hypothetical protein